MSIEMNDLQLNCSRFWIASRFIWRI